MDENKQKLCNMLCRLFRATRAGSDVVDISYDEKAELVTVLFDSGGKRIINVAMDSGIALIKDVVNHIDIG